ncbi:MAG: DUF1987 domain-containing protein [Bacteroidetes bacterium]|jgi:hypothetical protein|nr:DUF1987 domain-containing protein [Bacteroidota bacterium]
MESLRIEGLNTSPEVDFKPEGKMLLKGRAIPENPIKMFEPMMNWVKDFKGDNMVFDINLEYLNTGASLVLFDLLKAINDKATIKSKKINWHYEEGDDDGFETGKLYEHQLKDLIFEYFVEAEVF